MGTEERQTKLIVFLALLFAAAWMYVVIHFIVKFW